MYRLVIPFLALGVVSCASQQNLHEVSADHTPEWYENRQQSTVDTLYEVDSQTSNDMQFAIDKAIAGARTKIAGSVQTAVENNLERVREESGVTKDSAILNRISDAGRQVANASLRGSVVMKQKAREVDGVWRAWVMVGYPRAAVDKAMVEQVKSDEELYSRFRASQLLQNLDAQIEKHK